MVSGFSAEYVAIGEGVMGARRIARHGMGAEHQIDASVTIADRLR